VRIHENRVMQRCITLFSLASEVKPALFFRSPAMAFHAHEPSDTARRSGMLAENIDIQFSRVEYSLQVR
jgi:hypothetical protein